MNTNTRRVPRQRSRSGLTLLFRHGVGTYRGNEPARNSSENARPQSSQFAELLWIDPVLHGEIDAGELISTKKNTKKLTA